MCCGCSKWPSQWDGIFLAPKTNEIVHEISNNALSGREENDCKIGSLSISTKVWGWPGIELAIHNYFVHATLRFQIRATHAYWSSNVSWLTQKAPPQTIAPPHTHRHWHDIGAPHIDIQGDVRIIHGKPRWSPHSLKSIYNQPVRM